MADQRKTRSFSHLDSEALFERVMPLSAIANTLRRFIDINDGNRHNDHDSTPTTAGLLGLSKGRFVSSEFSAERAESYLAVLNEALANGNLTKEQRANLEAALTPLKKAVQAAGLVRDPAALEALRAQLAEQEQRLAAMQEAGTTAGRNWERQNQAIAHLRAEIDNAANPDARHIRAITETDIPRAGGEAARRALTTRLQGALTLVEASLDQLARPLPTGDSGGVIEPRR